MNTTAITFERQNLAYTLTGDDDDDLLGPSGLSILLLNRGGKPFREELLKHLSRLGTREILSIEEKGNRVNTESWNKELSNLRLLFFQSEASWGEKINIGIKEARGEFVLVLWNDMELNAGSISSRVFSKIEERKDFCTLPLLYDKQGSPYPSCYIPKESQSKILEMLAVDPQDSVGSQSLFPFDFTGIYHRQKFLNSGGFDGSIENPYWQWMDLGFRAAMGGEQMIFQQALKLYYQDQLPQINITANRDYSHFYLKTLALKIRQGRAFLPGRYFFTLWMKSSMGFKEARRCFNRVRLWLNNRQYSFKRDAYEVIHQWSST